MARTKKVIHRCSWADNDPLMRTYHDEEWGVPERDGRALWEALMLDGFQAGLSWITVLRKREAFRKAFRGFDPKKVARMGEADIERLLQNEGIIRSRAKIEATINGAKIYMEMASAGEDFSQYIWGMAGEQADSEFRADSGEDSTVGGDLCVAEEARLQVCWAGDCLCVDAGGWHRQ